MTTLKARLAAGEQLVGALLRMPAEETLEMVGVAGLDFVIIDAEHGPADIGLLRQHLALAELHAMAAVVRVGSREPALVLRALDAGAQGIIAPHVDTPDQAAELVDAAHYPPLGHRGFATYGRTGRFGTVTAADHLRNQTANTLVIAMIESPQAVANTADILAVPGVDGYFIGPSDLRVATGPDDPSVEDAIQRVHATAAETDAVRLELVGTPAAAQQALATGAQLVVYNLTQVWMDTLRTLRVPQP
jgi:4-hydroxy-2-oxoheptanedioate aldolase